MRAAAAGRSLGRLLGKGREMGSWGDGDRGGDAGASDSGPGWWARGRGGEHVGQAMSATESHVAHFTDQIPTFRFRFPPQDLTGFGFSKGHGPQLHWAYYSFY
jgi:hypothetical protein